MKIVMKNFQTCGNRIREHLPSKGNGSKVIEVRSGKKRAILAKVQIFDFFVGQPKRAVM
jgi:hypothetical protein